MAVGACADMMLTPGGSLAIGSLAGILSVCGFQYIQASMFSFRKVSTFLIHTAMPAEDLEDP